MAISVEHVSAEHVSTEHGDSVVHGAGLLIAFEGGDGAGKSSQAVLLAQALALREIGVRLTGEPGGTALGVRLRRLLLESGEPLSARAEALLFAADRAEHVAGVIGPALDRGEVVITDRFVDSSLAYQGAGRGLAVEDLKRISRWVSGDLVPDLTVLLDIEPERGLARIRGPGAGPDRLEAETLAFHRRVRAGFRALAEAESNRYLVLDADRPADYLAAEISATVMRRLEGRAARDISSPTAGQADGTPAP
ncbi:MAG: dTMP kinase [Jatrophihabitans sp.]